MPGSNVSMPSDCPPTRYNFYKQYQYQGFLTGEIGLRNVGGLLGKNLAWYTDAFKIDEGVGYSLYGLINNS